MDYYPPTEPIDRPITEEPQFTAQPNTKAPIAHVPQEQFAIPPNMRWLTPRNIAISIGGVVMASILFVASRGNGTTQTMTVYPPEEAPTNMKKVNEDIVKNNYSRFSELKEATDLKIDEIQRASINERAQEILAEAKRHVSDPRSGCYRAFNGATCYSTLFLKEQRQRYMDAIAVRQWKKSNDALFEFNAARVALDGISQNLPFDAPITFGAMSNEIDMRDLIQDQSQNAIATDIYQGVRKKK